MLEGKGFEIEIKERRSPGHRNRTKTGLAAAKGLLKQSAEGGRLEARKERPLSGSLGH
jgi:hypothetical protein